MRVLHYYPWGYFEPITCGADVIAANQLEYFRRREWDVDVLLLASADRDHQADAFERRYPWLRSVRIIDEYAADFTFRDKLSAHERLARSSCFRDLAREGHDLFLANYVFSAPLLEPLPRGCVKVLEALDIMNESFSLHKRSQELKRNPMAEACDAFLGNMELELYRLFDAILFINEQESRLVEPVCPGRTHLMPAMLPWEIAAERSADEHSVRESFPTEPFDLIFVGSNAPANIRGFTFFYRQIFVPYLRKRQVRLAVIGKVCDNLDFDDWYVTKLGNVPGDLRAYYERSKLVIIPILDGSGLSIKTLECLANGRAVATTPVGARGLRPDPDAFLELDMVADPQGTAQSILDVLDSEPRRTRMQRKAQEYYRAHFGADRYFAAMDGVMESLGIPSQNASVRSSELAEELGINGRRNSRLSGRLTTSVKE